MAEEQEALRRRIAEKRQEISDDVARIEDELRHDVQTYERAISPRHLVSRLPLPMLGLAMVVGAFVGVRVADLLMRSGRV